MRAGIRKSPCHELFSCSSDNTDCLLTRAMALFDLCPQRKIGPSRPQQLHPQLDSPCCLHRIICAQPALLRWARTPPEENQLSAELTISFLLPTCRRACRPAPVRGAHVDGGGLSGGRAFCAVSGVCHVAHRLLPYHLRLCNLPCRLPPQHLQGE